MKFILAFALLVSLSSCNFLMPSRSGSPGMGDESEPVGSTDGGNGEVKVLKQLTPSRLVISGLDENQKNQLIEKSLSEEDGVLKSPTLLTLLSEDSTHYLEFTFFPAAHTYGITARHTAATDRQNGSAPDSSALELVTKDRTYQLSLERGQDLKKFRVKGLGAVFAILPDGDAILKIRSAFRDERGQSVSIELPVRRRPKNLVYTPVATREIAKDFLFLKQENEIYTLVQAFNAKNAENYPVTLSLQSSFRGKLSFQYRAEKYVELECRSEISEARAEVIYSRDFIVRPLDRNFLVGGNLDIDPMGSAEFGVFSKDPLVSVFAQGGGRAPAPEAVNALTGCKRICKQYDDPRFRFGEDQTLSASHCIEWETVQLREPRTLAVHPIGMELNVGADRIYLAGRYNDQSGEADPAFRSFLVPTSGPILPVKGHNE